MEQRTSEVNRSSALRDIPCILWNPEIHYHIHKSLPRVRILGQLSPGHATNPNSWRSIFISPSTPRFSSLSLSLMFPYQKSCRSMHLSSYPYVPCAPPSHFSWFVLFWAQQPPMDRGLLIHEFSRSHATTHHSR